MWQCELSGRVALVKGVDNATVALLRTMVISHAAVGAMTFRL